MPGGSTEKDEEISTLNAEAEVCRICMLTAEEAGSALENAGCYCTGSLSWCHRQCIEKWMVYQRSRVCELCHGLFQFELDQNQVSENIQKELLLARERHARGCRSRRIWYLICTCMLVLTATLSVFLSIYAVHFDDDLFRLMTLPMHVSAPHPPLPHDWVTTTTTTEAAPTISNRPHVFCIVVSVWLVALVVVSVPLWVFVELVLWPREAQLVVNVAWFSILYEIYERLIAAEEGILQRALLISSREAAAAAAAAENPTAVRKPQIQQSNPNTTA